MTASDSIDRQIQAGRDAQRALDAAGPLLRDREFQIQTEMLGWFRSIQDGVGQNDPHIAMRYIAMFSEVRALLEELHRRIDQGERAMGKFMENNGAAHVAAPPEE